MRVWLAVGLLFLIPHATAHDMGVGFDPAADAGLFPEPNEVQAAILAAEGSPGVVVHEVGTSVDGNPIRMLAVTNLESDMPLDNRTLTLIMTQQHGNEPAGTPAALLLIDQLTSQTGVWEFLDNQILLLLPQINPDGSAATQRANAAGTDINRDHVSLTTPEAQALHALFSEWDIHMAMDHHEYGGTGIGYPSPVHIYDYDLTTMFPNHGNVRTPTAQLTQTLNYDHIYPHVRADGYTISDYGWTTVGVGNEDPVKLQQLAGGPDPGILRNNYGLNNIVGLLVESFVQPEETPFASFERRVGSHLSVMEAVLKFGAEHGEQLQNAKRESERLNRENPMEEYVEGETTDTAHGVYETDADLSPLWALHGFPAPIQSDSGWLYHADHGRAGLVHALLNPSSSRMVAQGEGAGHLALHPDQEHADYGGPDAPLEVQTESPEATTPGAPVVALLAALGGLAVLRRK